MQRISLLGVPFDLGQDRSGVRRGYSCLLEAGVVERLERIAQVVELGEVPLSEKTPEEMRDGIKFLSQASLANHKISLAIEELNLSSSFLLNIGGDHGMALGTVHGVLQHRPDSVVIWADAHGDINTPASSPSGNFHGMPVAFILKLITHPEFGWITRKLLPERLILIGPRDLDQGELEIIERHQIQYFSSEDLNRLGSEEVVELALRKADPLGVLPIHLSFDVDIFDQSDVASTGTKVSNGPEIPQVLKLGKLLGETGRLKSMDLVELNPELGSPSEVRASIELVLNFLEATLIPVFKQRSFETKLPGFQNRSV